MAMLAEPRRKQRWTLNPRGKQWSEDSNKFGQKMLEKMGWTSGKGLGAKEQGITDHVRVKFKEDAAGLGFSKDDQDKCWIEHQENFNELLQKLQTSEEAEKIAVSSEGKESADLSGQSLEMKSKQSRARVHYQKFTRGKDVNKYSTKDLANIFGKKDFSQVEIVEETQEPTEAANRETTASTEDTTAGVLTIKGGNMSDYFKSKFPNFHLTPRKQSRDDNQSSESESECHVGFGFASPSISAIFSMEKGKMEEITEKTPKKRKSEFYVETPTSKIKEIGKVESSENFSGENQFLTPKTLKIHGNSMRNEDNSTKIDFEKENLDSNGKKSKKKQKKNGGVIECIPQISENSLISENPLETPKKIKKSKKKNSEVEILDSSAKKSENSGKLLENFVFENPGLDLNSPDIELPKKSKKSKKNYEITRNSEIFEENSEKSEENFVFENLGLDLSSPHVEPLKKSKKSKKNYKIDRKSDNVGENYVFENPALDLNSPEIVETSKKKSKKITENCENSGKFEVFREPGVSNDALDLSDELNSKKRVTFKNEVEYNTDSSRKKKLKRKLDKFEVENEKLKKKKMKKQANEVAFVNEALEVDVGINQEIFENEENERKDQIKIERPKKKRRISMLETITEIPEEEKDEKSIKKTEEDQDNCVEIIEENAEIIHETPSKKKKKDKKKKKNDEELKLKGEQENEVKIQEDLENQVDVNENFGKSDKKKSKKDKKKENSEQIDENSVVEMKNEVQNNVNSPIEDKPVGTKKKLKDLFIKTPVLEFNGSNINEIIGYGVNVWQNN